MHYAVMLQGIPPQRALHQRVSHNMYVVQLNKLPTRADDTSFSMSSYESLVVMPFNDVVTPILEEMGVHSVLFKADNYDFLSVSLPGLSRHWKKFDALIVPMPGVKSAVAAWSQAPRLACLVGGLSIDVDSLAIPEQERFHRFAFLSVKSE